MKKYSTLIALIIFVISCQQKTSNQQTTQIDSVKNTDSTFDDNDTLPLGGVKSDDYWINSGFVPDELKQFVPDGYLILNRTFGDLNLDEYDDMILVLKKKDEDSLENAERPLLILTAKPDSTFEVAAKNDSVVYCLQCGGAMGDPFMDVVINKGYFSVEHYGGAAQRWSRTTTFKYSKADNYWFLHKDGHESFDATDESEKKTTKIFTTKDFGKVRFDDFNIYAN